MILATTLRRLGALILDVIIFSIPFTVLVAGLIFLLFALNYSFIVIEYPNVFKYGLIGIFLIAHITYFGAMEGSRHQGTLGKKMFHLKVTDAAGNPLSMRQSFGRALAKCLLTSGLTSGIGYLFALFSERRQTLHDMAAGTLVLCSRDQGTRPDDNTDSGPLSRWSRPKVSTTVRSDGWLLSGFVVGGKVVRLSFTMKELKASPEGLVIGRDEALCHIPVEDDSVSRRHARISLRNGSLIIEDLNSSNGTFVNGQRLGSRGSGQCVELTENSNVILGGVDLNLTRT